jgi:hypothetical protein
MLCVENANDGWPDFNLMLDLRLLGSRLLLSILLDSSLHVSSLHVSSLHVSSLILRSRFLPALKQKPACGRFLKRDHDHVPDAESHRVKSAKSRQKNSPLRSFCERLLLALMPPVNRRGDAAV